MKRRTGRQSPGRKSEEILRQTAFPAAKARSRSVAEPAAAAGGRRFRSLPPVRERVSPLAGLASRHLQTYPCVLWKHGNLAGLLHAFFMLTLVRSRMATAVQRPTRLIRMIARIVVKTLRVKADALISLCPAPLVLKQSDVGQTCPTVTMLCQYVMGIS